MTSSRITGIAIFIIIFILYASTLTPTVDFGDSGDFALAAYVLGIPHPPGFPLLTLLGKLAMLAIPFGSMAWRMGLIVSALAGALSCTLVYAIIYTMTHRIVPAAIGALALGVSGWLWSQSAMLEVYSLNLLFFLAIQYLYLRWRQTDNTSYLYGLCATAGLSLTNHMSIVFYAVIPMAAFIAFRFYRDRLPIKQAIVGIACFIGPLWLYLYLPIAASFDPVQNWGDPSTLSRFIDHVAMRQYEGFVTWLPLRLWPRSLWLLARSTAEQFWLLTPLCLFGLLKIPKVIRGYFFTSLISAIGFGMIAARINPTIHFYFIPVFAQLAIAAGLGINSVSDLLTRKNAKYLAIGLVVISFAIAGSDGFFFIQNSKAPTAAFAESILRQLPQEAVIITDEDLQFPIQYVQYVENIRPDVIAVTWKVLRTSEAKTLKDQGIIPANLDTMTLTTEELVERIESSSSDRQLFLSHFHVLSKSLDIAFFEPIFEVISHDDDVVNTARLIGFPDGTNLGNREYRMMEDLGAENFVLYLASKGRHQEAEALASAVLETDPGNILLWGAKSTIAGCELRKDEAIEYAMRAVDAGPYRQAGYHWLASAYEQNGQTKKAVKNLELALDHSSPSNQQEIFEDSYHLALLYLIMGEYSKAEKLAKTILDFSDRAKDRKAIQGIIDQAQRNRE